MSRITPRWSLLKDEPIQVGIAVGIVFLIVGFLCMGFKKQYGCPDCGHVAHPTDAYCAQCGKQLRIKE